MSLLYELLKYIAFFIGIFIFVASGFIAFNLYDKSYKAINAFLVFIPVLILIVITSTLAYINLLATIENLQKFY